MHGILQQIPNAGAAGNSAPTNGNFDFKLVNGVKSVEFGGNRDLNVKVIVKIIILLVTMVLTVYLVVLAMM